MNPRTMIAIPCRGVLNIDNILRVAREAQVDAVHPGYRFLYGTTAFAQAVINARLVCLERRRPQDL